VAAARDYQGLRELVETEEDLRAATEERGRSLGAGHHFLEIETRAEAAFAADQDHRGRLFVGSVEGGVELAQEAEAERVRLPVVETNDGNPFANLRCDVRHSASFLRSFGARREYTNGLGGGSIDGDETAIDHALVSGPTSSRPYVTITADTHAGASLDVYRTYLDPKFLSEFDSWREAIRKGPIKKAGKRKTKNWDTAERWADMEADGVCAEVIFPNTITPFLDRAALIAPPPLPERFERELAGMRAHNRWLADWCKEEPVRRAGIGMILLNDVDEAIKDVEFIAKNGLRGGVLLPLPADDQKYVKPLYAPEYDRLWAAIQDCDLVINQHGGAGSPDYGPYPAAEPLWIVEVPFFSTRGFKQLILSGVFARFPKLRYILTESGAAWVPPMLARMDEVWMGMRAGMIGEMDYSRSAVLPEAPSFYAKRNCWYGASFPSPAEIADRHKVGVERILWGSDYPHYEGTFPFTREALRLTFADVAPEETRAMLGENAAKLYGFDLDALAPIAERVGLLPEYVQKPLDEIPEAATSPMLLRERFERAMR
jgi:predicted TIM-barrel fold metal-dependent hydrolase